MLPTFDEVDLEVNCSYYLVSYVDVLGQGAPIQAIADLSPTAKAEATPVFAQAIERILGLRGLFDTFSRAMADDRPAVDNVPPERLEHYRAFRRVDVRVRPFSDSLVVSSRLRESDEFGRWVPVNTIRAHLYGLAGLSIMALAMKIPLRIGVSLSLGIDLEGDYVGPALGEAYDLERKVAQYPRIVVHPRLRTMLTRHGGRNEANAKTPAIDEAARKLANETASLLIPISSSADMLDILNPLYAGTAGPFERDTVAAARQFVIEQYKEHSSAGNETLSTRYAHLLAYFDQHPETWSPEKH